VNSSHNPVDETSFAAEQGAPMSAPQETDMYDPYFDHRLDPNAFPPLLRAASAILSIAVVGAVLLETFFTAARIVA